MFVDLILNDYMAMQFAVLMNINNFNTFKWPFCFIVVNIDTNKLIYTYLAIVFWNTS